MYLIIFYICIFLVFVIIIDFLYVAIASKHKKSSFTQPVQILRITCHLIATVLFIPFIGKLTLLFNTYWLEEIFLSLSACEYDAENGGLKHIQFEGVVCFQSIHILHIAFSYIIFLIFVGMSILVIYMHYENRFSKNPSSK